MPKSDLFRAFVRNNVFSYHLREFASWIQRLQVIERVLEEKGYLHQTEINNMIKKIEEEKKKVTDPGSNDG